MFIGRGYKAIKIGKNTTKRRLTVDASNKIIRNSRDKNIQEEETITLFHFPTEVDVMVSQIHIIKK